MPVQPATKTQVSSVLSTFVVVTIFISTVPTTGYAAVGRTVGVADVTRLGEYTYSVPIVTPPGVKGLTPKLSLNYSHRRPQVHIGIGWALTGQSAVARCPKTVAQDGVAEAILLTTADRFCLDGNRLRLTSGSYGGANSTYRLQTDTAARVTVMGLGAASDPDWFKVEQKNGLVYEYGRTPSSRVESWAPGKLTTAHTWAVSKILDREGNAIEFIYEEDTTSGGGHRLLKVEYTSNAVQGTPPAYRVLIAYEPKPTSDMSNYSAWLAGGAITNSKRMKEIDVIHIPSSTLVRRYKLNYEFLPWNGEFSRLSTLQECAGAAPDCFSETTFAYAPAASGVGSEVSSGVTTYGPLAIDINGDGRTDIVYSSTGTSGTGKWWYQLANSSGGFAPAVNSNITNTNVGSAIAIDHNGDAKDDLLVNYSGSTWWVMHGSAAGLSSPVNTGLTYVQGTSVAMDWNGDGRDDVVRTTTVGAPTTGIYVNLRNSTGVGFSSTSTRLDPPLGGTTYLTSVFGGQFPKSRVRGLDMNGDGIRDFMYAFYNFQGTVTSYGSRILLGAGKGLIEITPAYIDGLQAGDINDDGYKDIAYVTGGTLYYSISRGNSLSTSVSLGTVSPADFAKSVFRDWNSDGLDDLLVPISSAGTWRLYLSTGSGLSAGTSTGVSTASLSLVLPMDLNGDGLDDIGYIKSTGQYAVLPHTTSTPHLLNSITDGYLNSIAISYLAITQGGHTAGTGATFPAKNFQGPIVVVRQVAASNGIGGTRTLTYDYTDARINVQSPWQNVFIEAEGGQFIAVPNPSASPESQDALQDAGNVNQTQFIGFSSIKVTDSATNLVAVTDYSLADPPFTGVITGHRIYQPGGVTPIATTSNTWAAKDATGSDGTHYLLPYLQQSIKNEYEVGGAFNSNLKRTSTTTLNVVDAYGTATTTTNTVTEPLTGANGLQPGASYTTQTVLSAMWDSASTWCLGRPGQIQVTASHNQAFGTSIQRTRSQTWDNSALCRLTSEVIEPLSAAYALTRALEYDAFGNVKKETLSGKKDATNVESRETQADHITGASEPGRLPVKITNAEGEIVLLAWDYAKSLETSRTDPNGVSVTWQFDDFGRITREDRSADSTATTWAYHDCVVSGGCFSTDNKMVLIETALDASDNYVNDVWTYLDKFDRVLTTASRTLDGNYDRNDVQYNAQGLLLRSAAPCKWSDCSSLYWTTVTYDAIGRPTQITRPISASNSNPQSDNLYYEGLTTRFVDAESKPSTHVQNVTGAVIRSVSANNYHVSFDFDAFGSLVRTTDSQSNTLLTNTFDYGVGAFRRNSVDMDTGSWMFTPNAFGDVYGWTDGKGQSFGATFDKLSRLLTRTEMEGTSTWQWGATAAQHNVGQLVSVSGYGYGESYSYDSSARLSRRRVTADAATYDFDFAYHADLGALHSIQYPESTNGCRVQIQYGYQYGFMSSVTDVSPAAQCTLASGTVIWQANTANPRNQITRETLGNGIVSNRTFDAVTGSLQTITSGPGGGSATQNLGYLYDRVGNMAQRQDNRVGLTENFYYDDLHRLDHVTLNGNPTPTLDPEYEPNGNISSMTGVGSYTYHTTKKHAVTAAGANTFSYDDNGNVIARNGNIVTWYSYNLPNTIGAGGSNSSQFFYGPERQRWKQVASHGGTPITTWYIGGLLEKVLQNGVTQWRHYVPGPSGTVAIYKRTSDPQNSISYLLHDGLGSVDAFMDGTSVYWRMSYGAFGERRDASDWSGPPSATDLDKLNWSTRFGFTEHEMLDNVSLVHMNGRVYDPIVGRFISADPFIPDSELTQSYNRYAYVRNNPLSFVDPTGFCEEYITYRRDPNAPPPSEPNTWHVAGDLWARCIGLGDEVVVSGARPTPSHGGGYVEPTMPPDQRPRNVPDFQQWQIILPFTMLFTLEDYAIEQLPDNGIKDAVELGSMVVGPGKFKAAGRGLKQGFDYAYHYTFSRLARSIRRDGLRPGAYATRNGTLSPLQAHIDLALPPNRGLPDAIVRVDLNGLRSAGFEIPGLTRVTRNFGLPGGGWEMQFPYSIPPQFITVITR